MSPADSAAAAVALRRLLDVPDEAPDWATLTNVEAIARMQDCPQSPQYHREGDVATHTRMVLDELRRSPQWLSAEADQRGILQMAALLHDAGKPLVLRREGHKITAPGHATAGAHLARRLLWTHGLAPDVRERICGLISRHMVPHHLYERPEEDRRRNAGLIALLEAPGELEVLVEADARGRLADDVEDLLLRIALGFQIVQEIVGEGFATDAGRLAFFAEPTRPTALPLPEPQGSRVWLLSGLPGAGKDHWTRSERPEAAVVSVDALRRRHGIHGGDRRRQGHIVAEARGQLREHLAAGREIVVNATNLTRRTRAGTIRTALAYDAHITAIRLETPREVLLARNAARPQAQGVPAAVIDRMAGRWQPPGLDEVHRVQVVLT